MKYLLLILLLSCNKPKKVCYYCTFGQQAPPREVCIEEWQRIEDFKFVDQNGNDLPSYCEKR